MLKHTTSCGYRKKMPLFISILATDVASNHGPKSGAIWHRTTFPF